jgi:hypothetical protein
MSAYKRTRVRPAIELFVITALLAPTAALAADPQPVISVASFGAVPGDGIDDTAAINAALDSLIDGGTVVLPPGEYHHAGQLYVTRDGTRVSGYGATLTSTNVDQQALRITGRTDVEVLGLALYSPATVRKSNLGVNAITVQSSGEVRIEDCAITGSSAVGIMVTHDSRDYLIRNNTVTGTMADGIHSTGRSYRGLIVGNVVSDVDDDGISVVSYVGNTDYTRDIQITGNRVYGTANGYGRGITVVGGQRIAVVGNMVEGTKAAGILVTSEYGYNSYAAKDVTVAGNVLRGCSWGYPPNHGGIFVYARAGTAIAGGQVVTLQNERVFVESNTIVDTVKGPAHLRVGGYSSELDFINNVIVDLDSSKPGLVVTDATQLQYTHAGDSYNGVLIP